jgi:hypothetical protein
MFSPEPQCANRHLDGRWGVVETKGSVMGIAFLAVEIRCVIVSTIGDISSV